MTPATTLSARICIRPVLSPFLHFPYAGLTILLYPILGYHSLLYSQLISFLVSLDYGSYDPCVPPSATRQRHHTLSNARSSPVQRSPIPRFPRMPSSPELVNGPTFTSLSLTMKDFCTRSQMCGVFLRISRLIPRAFPRRREYFASCSGSRCWKIIDK